MRREDFISHVRVPLFKLGEATFQMGFCSDMPAAFDERDAERFQRLTRPFSAELEHILHLQLDRGGPSFAAAAARPACLCDSNCRKRRKEGGRPPPQERESRCRNGRTACLKAHCPRWRNWAIAMSSGCCAIPAARFPAREAQPSCSGFTRIPFGSAAAAVNAGRASRFCPGASSLRPDPWRFHAERHLPQ